MRLEVTAKTPQKSDRTIIAPSAEIERYLEASRRVLVVTHVDPDGDAIGTQLAVGAYLRDLGKDVFLMRDSEIPEKYLFLHAVDRIVDVNSVTSDPSADTVVVLECPSIDRMGRVREYIHDEAVIINIDHHLDSIEFGSVNWIDTAASSVGEMVWRYFKAIGYKVSPEVAEQLYTAVLTDTGRFRYESTTPVTMCCAGEMIAAGANPQTICNRVYFDMRPEVMKLTGKVLNGIEFHHAGRACVLTLTRDMYRETGATESDTEGIVDFTLFNQGVVVGALLKEVDDKTTRVSFRSNNHIDVASIARSFGGGGHLNASGCTVPYGITQAKKEIVRLLAEVKYDR